VANFEVITEEPDPDRAQGRAKRRQHEHAESAESILNRADDMFADLKYPVTTEENVREALYNELTGAAGPADEYNQERDLDHLDDAMQDDVTDSGASDM